MLTSQPQPGLCAPKSFQRNCSRHDEGAWKASVHGVHDIHSCAALCLTCDRCRFVSLCACPSARLLLLVSFGRTRAEAHERRTTCSWHRECPRLRPNVHQEDAVTLAVRGASVQPPASTAPELRRSERQPGHPPTMTRPSSANLSSAALQQYLRILDGLGEVPRVLHTTYRRKFRLDEENPMIRLGLLAFLAHNPGWQLKQKTDGEMDAYLRRHLRPREWALLSDLHPVERSDAWRLLVMHREGGVYMDLDYKVNRHVTAV